MDKQILYKYFSDDDFLRVSAKVKEMEKITAGEIRVSIKTEKPFKAGLKENAEKEFYKLGMEQTRDKTGILIYIVLSERQFYIMADTGIDKKVSDDTWDQVRDAMQKKFRDGLYSEGIVDAVEKVGKILSEHFPIKPDDTNELSNKVAF